MEPVEVREVVVEAIQNANLARESDQQLSTDAEAVLFGRGSPLDSLGLVALLIDIEEALAGRGTFVTLTSERAMSRSRNPFRTVSSLATYISGLVDGGGQPA